MLNLTGRPGRSCRSPFREDRNPSFSIYEEGRKWKDHPTGEGGDAVNFLARALNLSKQDACRRLIELAGVSRLPNERTGLRKFVRSHDAEEEEKAQKRESWPTFETPAAPEIKAIADLRSLSIKGVLLAADRRLSRKSIGQAASLPGKAGERTRTLAFGRAMGGGYKGKVDILSKLEETVSFR